MRIILALGIAMAASPAIAAPAPAQLRAELLRLEAERQQAFVRGDREVLERQLAPDFTDTNFHGEVMDRAQEIAFASPGTLSIGATHVEDVKVRRYGNTAILTAKVIWEHASYHETPAYTADLSGSYRVTRVYVRDRTGWRLAASHDSRLPPVPTGAARSANR